MMTILSFPKIIAAAVNGPAIGIGVTLLFHCDLCYCTSNATFWIPFTRLALGSLPPHKPPPPQKIYK
jgi:enoyl-CoA hydratase/carnithine racemase